MPHPLDTDWLTFHQLAIPMPDGVQLAADLYLPTSEAPPPSEAIPPSEDHPVPALLELLPYRKDEDRAVRFSQYSYFVQRGYAVLRADIRGTGASEGTLPAYEYSEQEHDDAEALIHWLAAQDWCNGRVGVFGISWGGFNAIQLGMRAPEPLRAIVAACATDDLFFDDVHYLDGIMHLNQYEIRQDLTNALTRAPDFPLDEESLARGFDTEPWVIAKLKHQQDGPFWDRGSLNTDYARLRVPALLLGGYYDAYRDSIPRMLEHTHVPVQAIVGPWPHQYPHNATPGPRVEWRDRAVRWFDHFLEDPSPEDPTSESPPAEEKAPGSGDRPILDEPALTYFERDYHPPDPNLQLAPGRWRTAPAWPPPTLEAQSWPLEATQPAGASPQPALHATTADAGWPLRLDYVPTIGLEAGTWWGDLVGDQAPLDDHCLVFESAPLEHPVTILGIPTAHLRVSAAAATANWFLRLNDVAPVAGDSSSPERVTLVTGGARSGAHRAGPDPHNPTPEAIHPNEVFDLDVDLHFTSWTFRPGHRIRLAISNALWPMFWPTPDPMHTTIEVGSTLTLPIAPATNPPAEEPHLPEPANDPPYPLEPLDPPTPPPDDLENSWTRTIEEETGDTLITSKAASVTPHPWGRTTIRSTTTYRLNDAAPAAASVTAHVSRRYELAAARTVEWQCDFHQSSDPTSFHYQLTRRVLENDTPIRERHWTTTVPRLHH